jgi:cytochrome c peroxidase
VGPGALPYTNNLSAVGPLFALDEVAVSDVARSASEIAQAAFLNVSSTLQGATLASISGVTPLGLNAAEVRVPGDLQPWLNAGTLTSYARIGAQLFSDPNLSRDANNHAQGVSCQTCHIDARAAADGRTVGLRVAALTRNVPTTLNRAFATRQMLDGRADDLVAQALLPLANTKEMNANLPSLLRYLNDPASGYLAKYRAISSSITTVDAPLLAKTLAAFVLGQVSGDAPADQLKARVTTSLNASLQQRVNRGAALFAGKARCIACHVGSNFSDEGFHNTGTTTTVAHANSDIGRGAFVASPVARFAFKTPTLRNIALTGPYFHDGTHETLAAVINFYNCGGADPVAGVCPAISPAAGSLDLEMHPLGLSEGEKNDLALFLSCGLIDTARFPASQVSALCR